MRSAPFQENPTHRDGEDSSTDHVKNRQNQRSLRSTWRALFYGIKKRTLCFRTRPGFPFAAPRIAPLRTGKLCLLFPSRRPDRWGRGGIDGLVSRRNRTRRPRSEPGVCLIHSQLLFLFSPLYDSQKTRGSAIASRRTRGEGGCGCGGVKEGSVTLRVRGVGVRGANDSKPVFSGCRSRCVSCPLTRAAAAVHASITYTGNVLSLSGLQCARALKNFFRGSEVPWLFTGMISVRSRFTGPTPVARFSMGVGWDGGSDEKTGGQRIYCFPSTKSFVESKFSWVRKVKGRPKGQIDRCAATLPGGTV